MLPNIKLSYKPVIGRLEAIAFEVNIKDTESVNSCNNVRIDKNVSLRIIEINPVITQINDYIAHPSLDGLKAFMSSDYLQRFTSAEMADHLNEFLEKFNAMYQDDQQAALRLSADFMNELKVDIFNAPLIVGASGAVFGLLLAYGMTFPNNLIFIYGLIPLKAKYLVIIYGLLELYSGIHPTQGDNVAHFAHLGGLIFGLLLILYWRSQSRNRFDGYQ